jgi:hypothetical protein
MGSTGAVSPPSGFESEPARTQTAPTRPDYRIKPREFVGHLSHLKPPKSRGIHSQSRDRPQHSVPCEFSLKSRARGALCTMIPILALLTALSMAIPTASWEFPIRGADMSSISKGFDPPQHIGAHGHRGVDFYAPPGTAVYAVGNGVIKFAGNIAGKPTVSLDHGWHPRLANQPIRSTYEPVHSILPKGTAVSAGQLLGFTTRGNSHCERVCLHFGLKVGDGSYLSPLVLWSRSTSLLPSARG